MQPLTLSTFKKEDYARSKFVVASTDLDRKILEQNGFKKVHEFTSMGTRNYVYLNNPMILSTFNLGNMKLSYTDKLMF